MISFWISVVPPKIDWTRDPGELFDHVFGDGGGEERVPAGDSAYG